MTSDRDQIAKSFEAQRTHLHAVAYRMLGSPSEADDAVQEAWLRLSRSETDGIANLGGWLTTVISRVCLDMLRARKARREDAVGGQLPDPIAGGTSDPDQERVLADSVSLALLVVLETLAPAERLAFVLHDMFDLPFDEIAPIVGRTPTAARQLASRARRRVQGSPTVSDAELAEQRTVVDAFLAAVRSGDFDALVAVLDPEVVRRVDTGGASPGVVRGARQVAKGALGGYKLNQALATRVVLIDGRIGIIALAGDALHSAVWFTIADGQILELDVVTDPARLAQLQITALDAVAASDA